ncbi:MAG TPA: hypothetical protein VI138_03235 [Candidatus Dormibacteraeota bacterium]
MSPDQPHVIVGQTRPSGGLLLRRLALLLIALSLVQYLVGMGLNLFVAVPRHHPGAEGNSFFGSAYRSDLWGITQGGLLAIHITLGLLLGLAAIRLLVAVLFGPGKGSRTASLVGVLAVLGAGFNGAAFLVYHRDLSSMVMAGLFALAVLCFGWVLYRAPVSAP